MCCNCWAAGVHEMSFDLGGRQEVQILHGWHMRGGWERKRKGKRVSRASTGCRERVIVVLACWCLGFVTFYKPWFLPCKVSYCEFECAIRTLYRTPLWFKYCYYYCSCIFKCTSIGQSHPLCHQPCCRHTVWACFEHQGEETSCLVVIVYT